MYKFENTANIGDIIKAFDFRPMSDREDSFLVGKVIDKGMVMHPHYNTPMYAGYTVEVLVERDGYKKFETAYVPFETDFMEYDERVQRVITAEEIEMLIAVENEEVFH